MSRSRNGKNILLGSAYLTLFVGVLYFVLPPRVFLNHDGFRKIEPGMRLWEVEWLLGGPPGVYYPATRGGGGFRTLEGSIYGTEGNIAVERVWSDNENCYEVGFDKDGRVMGTHKRHTYIATPNRLAALIFAFWDWALVIVLLLLIPRRVWKPRRLDHEGYERIQLGMTQKQVSHLLGGPPGIYYPTYEGARTHCSGPAYDGPAGTLALDWWDSTERFTVYFDDEGHVVGKHSPDEWRSIAYTCRLMAMLFGSREPTPLPPQRFDGMMNAQPPTV